MGDNLMSILVIGGTSFIGSSMVKQLINQGYTIDLLVSDKNEVTFNGARDLLLCDRKDNNNLKNLLINKSYEYILDISDRIQEDVMNLLNVSTEKNVKKYILCSSRDVYNDFSNTLKLENLKYSICSQNQRKEDSIRFQ